jgi:hypothetical protein
LPKRSFGSAEMRATHDDGQKGQWKGHFLGKALKHDTL